MKIRLIAIVAGVVILAAGALGSAGLFSSETAYFSFPVTKGKGTMAYLCQAAETAEDSEENARAAHSFFEPALRKSARLQAKAMAASMSPDRPSSDIAAELEVMNAEADAHRKAINREMQHRFGCNYRGSS